VSVRLTASNLVAALGALREDGWKATLSGLGGARDKGRASNIRFCPSVYLDRATLAAAYKDNWLIRRIINAVPEESMRRGFGEGLETPEFDRLNYERFAEGALLRAACLGRLMGGAMVYVGYADGGADLTLPPKPGAEVSFLEVFHRYELTAVEQSRVRDTSDPQYGRPQVWNVTGQNRTGLVFHESRCIRFPGQPRADDFEATAAVDRDWWDSILQSIWEDAQRYGVFWQAVSHLMQISSVGVLSIDGLIDMIANQNQADAEARIDLLNEALSLTRLLLLDASKNESYKREAVSFSDVPGLLQELQLATAGAVDMPVTKLFGRAPAGMNATGDSDVRGWYDSVDTWRERVLKPRAEDLIARCERASSPVEIEWPPLWEPTEKECAEVEQLETNVKERLWSMGVATDSEIRKSLYEQKPLREYLQGEPPAEPTRAVTRIAVVPPGENAAAPADPEAEDEPAPAKPASPFPVKRDSLDALSPEDVTRLADELEARVRAR
jgi:phage-related protein (TIGR01555 family)